MYTGNHTLSLLTIVVRWAELSLKYPVTERNVPHPQTVPGAGDDSSRESVITRYQTERNG